MTGVKETVDFESREATTAESTQIRNELFVKETIERQQKENDEKVELVEKTDDASGENKV